MSRELDAKVAEAMGWRFWLEQRGGYRLAVNAKPGEREPWKETREEHQQPERYTPCTAIEAQKAGSFGRETPRFSTDPEACEEVIRWFLARHPDNRVNVDRFGDLAFVMVGLHDGEFEFRRDTRQSQEDWKVMALTGILAAVEAEKGAKQ